MAQPSAPAAEPSPADKETARNAYLTGVERYRAEDYHGALQAFQAADRIMGVPTTGLELGRTQMTLGLLVEARDRLLEVTRYPVRAGEPGPYAKARAEAGELAADLAKRIPSISIQVGTVDGPLPPDVKPKVTVDDAAVAPDLLDIPRRLNPGHHTVMAGAEGFVSQRQAITLAERDQRVLQFKLVRGSGDGASPEPGPNTGPDKGPVAPDAPGPEISPLVWVGFGVGAAGLLTGGITGGITLSKTSSLEDECPDKQCTAEQEADLDDAKLVGHVSTAGFVIGGVGVAVGIVGLALTDWDGGSSEPGDGAPESAIRLQPLLGPTSIGLQGSF
ncbi:MAG: hypothetical protein JRI23_30740 [Deltaproteobacteria bacterium]|nr:hypothetical protein [Deltaproteobacteria bacterium]MBW2536572.1 hypothetical protein [Deltaproteobacteria bacterium]